MTKQRRSFSAEFKREAADLVLKQKLQLHRSQPFSQRRVAGLTNSSRSAAALFRRAKR